MKDISACGAIKDDKTKCPIRYECKRFSLHLASLSKKQSHIKPEFVGKTCDKHLVI